MKHVLITGGPTNEAIDKVMKITNMSTGTLSMNLAKTALDAGAEVTLIINRSSIRSALYEKYNLGKLQNVKTLPIETTLDMYKALKAESENFYDTVIHAAAVGDYKPEFCFTLKDLAAELSEKIQYKSSKDKSTLAAEILTILQNPDCKLDDNCKIASYEPNLTVKLSLTMKLIENLRAWFPKSILIGCKLLENVTKERLFEVATRLCVKNDMDFILANDLAELRSGKTIRYLVTQTGYTGIELNGKGPNLLSYAAEHWF